MGLTITVTELAPEEYETRSYVVPNLLLQELSDLPLRGNEGAVDLLLPSLFDDDESTGLTDEESDLSTELIKQFVYLDEDVVRDDDLFKLELAVGALDSKGGSSSTRLSFKFEGRDFEFGDDPMGPVMPIDGTIETITLTRTFETTGRVRAVSADVEVKVAGADLNVTPSLFDDTDTFLSKLLRGDQVLEFSPFLIKNFASDGRNLTEGTARGGSDFITFSDDARSERMVGADLLFAGDFLDVNAGATLRGGADTFVGEFPVPTTGETDDSPLFLAGKVSGDAISVAGTLTGGNDVLNFTDSAGAAAGLFGDAVSASGTVEGGKDEIVGTAFGDLLVGDVGTAEAGSTVTGGNDTIFGLAGDDTLIGDVETVEGGATVTGGNDRLFGGAGDDLLKGNGGDDDLDGGRGRDELFGSTGDDFMIIADSADVEAGEIYDGGADTDDFILFASGFVDLRAVGILGMEGLRFGAEDGAEVVLLSSQIATGGFEPDALIKVFAPDGGADTLSVHVDDGGVDLSALKLRNWERGLDQVIVNGSSENDSITGSVKDDILRGDRGADEIDGVKGRDTMIGGGGNDTYFVNAKDTVIEEAGEGFDQIISTRNIGLLAENVEHATLDDVAGAKRVKGNDGANLIEGNSFDNVLIGGDGADQIFGVGGSNRLLGGDGIDLITGAEGNDTIFGGKQGDLIDGGRGNDLIKGGGGADEIFGGNNDDSIFGQAGDDILGGGDGVDSLLGGKGDDDLSGGAGNDTLRGGAGSDTLNGGSGDDLLDGQGKADTFVFEGNWGNDTIDGYSPSGTGGADDLLSIEGVLDLATFNSFATQAGDDVVFDNGTSTIRILDVELIDFTNADFI